MHLLGYSAVLLSLHGNTKAEVYKCPLSMDLWATQSSSCIEVRSSGVCRGSV